MEGRSVAGETGEVVVPMPQAAVVVDGRGGDDDVRCGKGQARLAQPRAQAARFQPDGLGDFKPLQTQEILLEARQHRRVWRALEDLHGDEPKGRHRPKVQLLLEPMLERGGALWAVVVNPDRAVYQGGSRIHGTSVAMTQLLERFLGERQPELSRVADRLRTAVLLDQGVERPLDRFTFRLGAADFRRQVQQPGVNANGQPHVTPPSRTTRIHQKLVHDKRLL